MGSAASPSLPGQSPELNCADDKPVRIERPVLTPRASVTRVAAIALLVLMSAAVGLVSLTDSAPARAAGSSATAPPTITAAPSSGPDKTKINFDITIPGCLTEWAGAFLLKDPVTSVSTDLENELVGNTLTPVVDAYNLGGNDTNDDGNVQFAGADPGAGDLISWQDGSTAVADLAALAQKWGAGATGTAYTLVVPCMDATTFKPITNADGSTVAAVDTMTLATDGSWQVGTATADSTAVTVTAAQDKPGDSTVLTAKVTDTTSPSTVPSGSVQFFNGTPSTGKPLAQAFSLDDKGVATLTVLLTQLPPGNYTISVMYTAGSGVNLDASSGQTSVTVNAASTPTPTDTATPTPTDSSTPNPTDGSTPPPSGPNGGSSTLTDGGTVTPGTAYDVSFGAGTFGDGDSLDVVLHSDPVDLGTVEAGSDGSLDFTLTADATSGLAAGSSHELVFTDGTTSADSQTISFTVAGSSPGSTGTDPSTGTSDPGTTGSNDPSTFLTDSTRWATGTPQGLTALLSAIVLAIGAGAAGWGWYWRRRRAAQVRG